VRQDKRDMLVMKVELLLLFEFDPHAECALVDFLRILGCAVFRYNPWFKPHPAKWGRSAPTMLRCASQGYGGYAQGTNNEASTVQ
jgi:hypothetical protein